MNRNKLFTTFLILFLLLSTSVVMLHNHDYMVDDDDCPICVAGDVEFATGPLAVAFEGIPCLTETTFVASAPALTDNLVFLLRSTRGPPA